MANNTNSLSVSMRKMKISRFILVGTLFETLLLMLCASVGLFVIFYPTINEIIPNIFIRCLLAGNGFAAIYSGWRLFVRSRYYLLAYSSKGDIEIYDVFIRFESEFDVEKQFNRINSIQNRVEKGGKLGSFLLREAGVMTNSTVFDAISDSSKKDALRMLKAGKTSAKIYQITSFRQR